MRIAAKWPIYNHSKYELNDKWRSWFIFFFWCNPAQFDEPPDSAGRIWPMGSCHTLLCTPKLQSCLYLQGSCCLNLKLCMVLLLSRAQKCSEGEGGIHSFGAFLPNDDIRGATDCLSPLVTLSWNTVQQWVANTPKASYKLVLVTL